MCGELLARRPAFERRRHAHTQTEGIYNNINKKTRQEKKGGNGREKGYTSSSSSNTRNTNKERQRFSIYFFFFLFLFLNPFI